MKRLFNVLILMVVTIWCQAQDSPPPTLLYAGKALDVVSGNMHNNVLIRISEGQITSFETDQPIPDQVFIDLRDYTILPGLMDCHTHLTADWYKGALEFDTYAIGAAMYGIVGVINARKTIEAGFTTVRDVHGEYYADVDLRDAINRGWVPGPRMLVTGPGLSITGGHGAWANWLSPGLVLQGDPGSIADGPEEVRKEVRKHIKNEVDWIKIFATGGFGSYGTIPGAAAYSEEELRIAVEEAANLGMKVAAHAHGAEGIKRALRAGVQSIEHGTYIDDEGLQLLIQNDAFLSMDLLSAHYELMDINSNYSDKGLTGSNLEEYKALQVQFNKAYLAGAKMVFSTDAGVYPHGQNARQFRMMVEAGMSPIDAIRSATTTAAQLLNLSDHLGTLEMGKWADIIGLKGNPLEDISLLEQINFVMKEGKIVLLSSSLK